MGRVDRKLEREGPRGDGRLARWLVGAGAAHLLGLLAVGVWGLVTTPPPSRAPARPPAADLWVELLREPPPLAPRSLERPDEHDGSPAPRAPRITSPSVTGALPAPAPEPPPREGPARRLSLDQLGLAGGVRAFPFDVPEHPSRVALAERRLNAALSNGLAEKDSARGLGVEGPAVRLVTELAAHSALPLTARARLRIAVGADGSTQAVSLLEGDAAAAEWRRIAEALRRSLEGRTLRVPAGSRGVAFELLVLSRLLSPSGGDPKALEVEAFAEARAKPGTPSIARLALMPKKAEPTRAHLPELASTMLRPMGGFSSNVLGSGADLSDLAAGARRRVTADLVRLDVY